MKYRSRNAFVEVGAFFSPSPSGQNLLFIEKMPVDLIGRSRIPFDVSNDSLEAISYDFVSNPGFYSSRDPPLHAKAERWIAIAIG